MLEEKPLKIPTISVSQTGGLTSMQQLIDTSANEIFSFKGSTSEMEENLVVLFRFYEKRHFELEERKENSLREFKSIVKHKLKKPIDLKKLYYEQFKDTIS